MECESCPFQSVTGPSQHVQRGWYTQTMQEPHAEHPNLTVLDHPVIQDRLSRLRNVETPSEEFRRLLDQISGLMTFRISRDLAVDPVAVQTPLELTEATQLRLPITLVPILRAGIGMIDGILALLPEARVGHLGVYRDEDTMQPVPYFEKMPADVGKGPVLVVDPMLATGGSAIFAMDRLKAHGCTDLRLICLVCAPEGVSAMREAHPEIPIYTAALDRCLNEQSYILPGLGDAGDRIFGTQ